MTQYTDQQLETMALESSPRGRNARYEIARRQSLQEASQPSVEPVEDVSEPTNDNAQDVLDTGEKPVETSTETSKRGRSRRPNKSRSKEV